MDIYGGKKRFTINAGSLKGGGFAVGSVQDGWLQSADPTAFISATAAESTAVVFCRAEISQKPFPLSKQSIVYFVSSHKAATLDTSPDPIPPFPRN